MLPAKSAFEIFAFVKLTFVKLAFRMVARIKDAPLKSRPVKSPPDRFTVGPNMYPPLTKYDALGMVAGADGEFVSPLEYKFVKSAFVKLAPVISQFTIDAFLRNAPVNIAVGPTKYVALL